jgi:hypothetical protein
VGSSKDRQPGLPGIGGEPGGSVYWESVVKRLNRGKQLPIHYDMKHLWYNKNVRLKMEIPPIII